MRGFPNKLIYPDEFEFWAQKFEHQHRSYFIELIIELVLIDILRGFLFEQSICLFIETFLKHLKVTKTDL